MDMFSRGLGFVEGLHEVKDVESKFSIGAVETTSANGVGHVGEPESTAHRV